MPVIIPFVSLFLCQEPKPHRINLFSARVNLTESVHYMNLFRDRNTASKTFIYK